MEVEERKHYTPAATLCLLRLLMKITPPLTSVLLLLACAAMRLKAANFDVKNFGATGDGQTLDTGAINQAIETAAAAGGGTVIFSAGNYLSFSIRLKSNITLQLEAGATIIAAEPSTEEGHAYDAAEPNPSEFYQQYGHTHWHNSLIWGENLENVSIIGPGRIFGRGLSKGTDHAFRSPLPEERKAGIKFPDAPDAPTAATVKSGPFNLPRAADSLPPRVGNKAIALKNCRGVIFRDFTIYHGGHFAILASGVDNWTCDNLKIDTNRDGIDFDCCQNVRVSNCSVNSPGDDGLCLKSTLALGHPRVTENITITNCQLSGYDEGTFLDGTRQRHGSPGLPTGRIKFGTESDGGFKNITISNCIFEYCRGFALEMVDGGQLEDVTITNITMRDLVNPPIFIRLGARLRAPEGTAVGVCRRIKISNLVAHNVSAQAGILIVGLPGHPIEDVSLSNIFIDYVGGGTKEQAGRAVPEMEKEYPEPGAFGILSSWGLFARHVKNLSVDHVELRVAKDDLRPTAWLEDVMDASFDRVKFPHAAETPSFMLKAVTGFAVHSSPGLPETNRLEKIVADKL